MLSRDTWRGGLPLVNQNLIEEAEAKDAVDDHWRGWRDFMRPLSRAFYQKLGTRVQTGPFKGMDVTVYQDPVWDDSNGVAKLIGSYECELHGVVEKALARKPDCIINAGCAEGYYAVGFARLLPDAFVYAMDISRESLNICERNAWLNDIGISRFQTIHGPVEALDLRRGEGKKLYFIDIEGYEDSALDPEICPDLLDADIIVECHDFFVGDGDKLISSKLMDRFSLTHDIEFINVGSPNPNNFPCLFGLASFGLVLMAITERRPPQTAWLACWSK